MQPITINIVINITPDGVEVEQASDEDTDEESDKLPGGVGFFMTDGEDYNFVEEGPYVTRIK